jgi:hypothetical protein
MSYLEGPPPPGQMPLLHLCCVCNRWVPFDRALSVYPDAVFYWGFNCPAHKACLKFEQHCRDVYVAELLDREEEQAAKDKAAL